MSCEQCHRPAVVNVGGAIVCENCETIQPHWLPRAKLVVSLLMAMLVCGCFQTPWPDEVQVDPKPDVVVDPVTPDVHPVSKTTTVLILYEKDHLTSYSRPQRSILMPSPVLKAWLDQQKIAWHIWDRDVTVEGDDAGSVMWREILAKLRPHYADTPILFIESGGKLTEHKIDKRESVGDAIKFLETTIGGAKAAGESDEPAQPQHSAAPFREFEIEPFEEHDLVRLAA